MAKVIYNDIIPFKGLDKMIANMLPFDEIPAVNSARWLDLTNLKGEIWLDVVGYEGVYKVSCYGRIMSMPKAVKRGKGYWYVDRKILRLKDNKRHGYYQINLYKEDGTRKSMKVHRIVAIAFYGDQSPKIINHIDENKKNPILSNLEWCTYKENSNHGTGIDRMKETLKRIGHFKPVALMSSDGCVLKKYECIKDAALDLNLSSTGIINSCKERRKYRGLLFRYLTDL